MYGSANWWKRLGHFSLRLDMNGNHSNSVSMINEDRSLEPVKSTTRDTGLNCEANVSYQPAWEVLTSLLPGIISIRSTL